MQAAVKIHVIVERALDSPTRTSLPSIFNLYACHKCISAEKSAQPTHSQLTVMSMIHKNTYLGLLGLVSLVGSGFSLLLGRHVVVCCEFFC